MEREGNQHFSFLASMLEKSEINHAALEQELDYDAWLHKMAGTSIPAKLGGAKWEEWKMSVLDGELHGMLMDGLNSQHAMR